MPVFNGDGPVPAGAEVLECPTPHGIVLGRIRAVDDEDAKVAAAIGREITLVPLDASGAASPTAPLGAAPGTPQSVGTAGAATFDELGDGAYLYMGWDSRYMLSAVQGVLDEAGLASEVFVKYSYIGNAM